MALIGCESIIELIKVKLLIYNMYINMRRGNTWDEFRDLDLSHWYRRQDKRSLEEIDVLISRKLNLQKLVG